MSAQPATCVGVRTSRSALFANWSIYPLTASTFDLIALLVFGMPYSAWRHDGVIWLLHDDGTDASDVTFEGAVDGVEKDGDPVAMPNLHTESGSGSMAEARKR